VQLGIAPSGPSLGAVDWSVTPENGIAVLPQSGAFRAEPVTTGASGGCGTPGRQTENILVKATAPGRSTLTIRLHTAAGVSLPPVVVDLTVTA
jgi:hypothetical protein